LRALRAAAVGAALFAVACALPHVGIFRGHIDTSLFQSYGDRTLHGEVPYRDFSLEYPPGALPAFVAPSLWLEPYFLALAAPLIAAGWLGWRARVAGRRSAGPQA